MMSLNSSVLRAVAVGRDLARRASPFFLAITVPLSVVIAWHAQNQSHPILDGAFYFDAAQAIYAAYMSHGIVETLVEAFWIRDPHGALTPLLIAPFIFLAKGSVRLSILYAHVFFYALYLYYCYRLMGAFLSRWRSAAGTAVIGLLPYSLTMGTALMCHTELFFSGAFLASLYHLLRADGFVEDRHALLAAVWAGVAICLRPIEGLVLLSFPILSSIVSAVKKGVVKRNDVRAAVAFMSAALGVGIYASLGAVTLRLAKGDDVHAQMSRGPAIAIFILNAWLLGFIAFQSWRRGPDTRAFKIAVALFLTITTTWWLPFLQRYILFTAASFPAISMFPSKIPLSTAFYQLWGWPGAGLCLASAAALFCGKMEGQRSGPAPVASRSTLLLWLGWCAAALIVFAASNPYGYDRLSLRYYYAGIISLQILLLLTALDQSREYAGGRALLILLIACIQGASSVSCVVESVRVRAGSLVRLSGPWAPDLTPQSLRVPASALLDELAKSLPPATDRSVSIGMLALRVDAVWDPFQTFALTMVSRERGWRWMFSTPLFVAQPNSLGKIGRLKRNDFLLVGPVEGRKLDGYFSRNSEFAESFRAELPADCGFRPFKQIVLASPPGTKLTFLLLKNESEVRADVAVRFRAFEALPYIRSMAKSAERAKDKSMTDIPGFKVL